MYYKLIEIFFNVSGMAIHLSKSYFVENEMDLGDITIIKEIFPLQVSSLSSKLKYLGYFIKSNGYAAGDWIWLLKRYDKHINHWCWRWLSLGGRLILYKYVLENLAIYSIYLCKIPIQTLNNIIKKTF